MKPKIFCLLGPTASGKTAIAIKLAQTLPIEIISVDSAMVYRGMDIGTAKPTAEELAIAPHRLIDLCDPAESYSAGQFCKDAVREIDDILAAGKTPLLVGGSMLYFSLLQRGFSKFPAADEQVRVKINKKAAELGWPAMHQQLEIIDPKTAAKLHANDSQRIQRALELHQITGKTLTELKTQQQWLDLPYEFVNLCLMPMDRQLVHQRIAQRCDAMLAAGLVDEVRQLYGRGDLSLQSPSIRLVGYRQVWGYLDGDYSQSEMRNRVIYATRQFAKRQFTWLRRWQPMIQFNADETEIFKKIYDCLE